MDNSSIASNGIEDEGIDDPRADEGPRDQAENVSASTRHLTYKTLDELGAGVETLSRELRGKNLKWPAKPSITEPAEPFDRLDLGTVALWLSHPRPNDLARAPCRGLLEAAVSEMGFAAPTTSAATIADLDSAVRQAMNVDPTRDLWPELNYLRDAMRLEDDAPLRHLVAPTDLISMLLVSRTAMIKDAALKARIAASWTKLGELLRNLVDRQVLPDTFRERLAFLINASHLPANAIAKASGIAPILLRQLLAGTPPRADMKGSIEAIERALGAQSGSLSQLIEAPRQRLKTDDFYDADTRRLFKVAGCDAGFLPANWAELTGERKAEIVEWIVDNIIGATPMRRMARHAFGEAGPHAERSQRQGPMSDAMQIEWSALKAFKTSEVPTTLEFARKKTHRSEGSQKITHGGRWRDTTARLAENYVCQVIASINRIVGDEAWQMGQGLGFLIVPEVQKAVSAEIGQRRYEVMEAADAFSQCNYAKPASKTVYAQGDALRLEILMGLFNQHTGYLNFEMPGLAPIPKLLDDKTVTLARSNWHGYVAHSRQKLRLLTDGIDEAAKVIRDTWMPILPILEMDEPLTPILRAIDRMEADRPDPRGSLRTMAFHDRNHLLLSLMVHGKLRRANYSKLSWRPDNTGNLRWDVANRRWQMVIAQSDMKNEGSEALPDDGVDLVLVLDREDPRLYKAIERWIGTVDETTGLVDERGSSRCLLHGPNSQFLFPGRPGQNDLGEKLDRGLGEQSISMAVLKFSARYLVWRPWYEHGIAGVLPFAAHNIRDIVATHYIKNTGSIEEAARALFDVPATLKRAYARFTSSEKSVRSNKIMRDTTAGRFAPDKR